MPAPRIGVGRALRSSASHLLAAAGVALMMTLAIPAAIPTASAEEDWTLFEFEAYNREYVDVRANTQWEREGPIRMTFSSRSHRLTVRDHSVELRPGPEGAHHARIRVNFSGEGDIVADIGMAGAETRLEDYVTAPPQEIEVLALVRFDKVDGGYDIETLEMQKSVDVEIESELGGRFAEICNSALALFGADCGAMLASFSSVTIDLPEAGGLYFIPDAHLSRAERHKLDRYLEESSQG